MGEKGEGGGGGAEEVIGDRGEGKFKLGRKGRREEIDCTSFGMGKNVGKGEDKERWGEKSCLVFVSVSV